MNKKTVLFASGLWLSLVFIMLCTISTFAQTTVSGQVSGTWTKAGSPYILGGNVTIDEGQSLNIEPGVEVRMLNAVHNFTIYGSLIAKGTATNPVKFNGFANTDNGTSHGAALYFYNSSGSSILENVNLDQLGEQGYHNGAIYTSTSALTVKNCKLTHIESAGIYIDGDTKPAITGNTFTKGTDAISGGIQNFDQITSNTDAKIKLRSGTLTVNAVMPEPGPGSYYELVSQVTIPDGKTLEIKAGAELVFPVATNTITVYGGLLGSGTAAKPVKFTGLENTVNGTSHGGAIYFYNSTTNSVLDQVIIDRLGEQGYHYAGVYINSSSVTIKNSKILNSEAGGVFIDGDVKPTINNNFFSKTADAVIAGAQNFDHITANTDAQHRIRSGTIGVNAVIPAAGSDSYYMLNGTQITLSEGKILEINPGADIRSMRGTDNISVYGTLNAKGTSTSPVRITGFSNNEQGTSHGGAIYFYSSSTGSVLENLLLDHMGESGYFSSAIYIASSSVSIKNSKLLNSETAGIYIDGDAKPLLTGNVFSPSIDAITGSLQNFDQTSGNTDARIRIRNGSVGINSTLPKAGQNSYYFLNGSQISILEGKRLTIMPGAEIRSLNATDMLAVYGTLTAKGTEKEPIKIIGFPNTQNGTSHGGGIYFYSSATGCELQYVQIDRMGDEGYTGRAISIDQNAVVSISNSSIFNSENHAITNYALQTQIKNTELYNNKIGLANLSGKVILTNSKIYSNSAYGIQNTATEEVDARNSYWGDPTGPQHGDLNPTGKGNKVSDKVLFTPWIKQLTQVEQTITLADINAQYVGAKLILDAKASSELPLSYNIITLPQTGVAELVGNVITFSGDTGTVNLIIKQAGDQYFKPMELKRIFKVIKRPQTITFAALPAATEGDAPFKLTATADSKLPVNYTIISGSATVENDIITLKGTGTVTIEAAQPGDQFYAPATAVQQSFVIYPKLPDIAVSQITANKTTVAPADSVIIRWKVGNIGKAAAVQNWTEHIYLQAADGTGRTFLQHTDYVQNANIEPDGSITREQSVHLPAYLNIGATLNFVVELRPGQSLKEAPGVTENNIAIQTSPVSIKKVLSLSLSTAEITEGSADGIQATVYRSGALTSALTFKISLSKAARFSYLKTVTIPVGQSGATFMIKALDNKTIEGDIDDELSISASGYQGAKAAIRLLDDDKATLSFTGLDKQFTEGQTVNFKVSTNAAVQNPLEVFLRSDNAKRFPVPASVVIPKGTTSAALSITIPQNELPETATTIIVSAGAAQHNGIADTLTIADDDLPVLELTFKTDLVTENAGPYAVPAVLRRKNTGNAAFTVNLSASLPDALILPSSITLGAGENEKAFTIGVVNNTLADGQRPVTVNAAVFLSSCGCTVPPAAGSTSAVINISDDDGPALQLSVDQQTLPEGKQAAAQLRIARNTDIKNALTVTLTSSDSREATLPATATIPAGKTFVEVAVTTISDKETDGSKQVYFKAAATGFATGSTWVLVTDMNKPDFQLDAVKINPAAAVAGTIIHYQYDIKNTGFATGISGVRVNGYLSVDDMVDDSDILVTEDIVNYAIPANASKTVVNAFTLPDKAGTYKLIFKVNPSASITELLNTNNTSSPVPLMITAKYTATAQVAAAFFGKGKAIPVTGTVKLSNGGAAKNEKVEIYIINNGIRRTIPATSDASGNFTANFIPLVSEAGHYEIGASYPGLNQSSAQDAFDILGVKINGGESPQFKATVNQPLQGTLKVENLSNTPLNNLTLTNVGLPKGAMITFGKITRLGANATAEISYTINATTASTGDVYDAATLLAKADEGEIQPLTTYYYAQAPGANITANSTEINTTVSQSKGERQVELKLINKGKGTSGSISISLPKVNWLSAVSPQNISGLAAGDTATVILKFTATDDVPFNYPVKGTIAVNTQNANSLNIPFTFEKVAEANGSAKITVTNQFTYYTQGAPNVADAHIQIRNYFTNALYAEGITDATGIFNAANLPEGKHRIIVEKQKHLTYNGIIEINPGQVKETSIFINYQAITFDWKVVPTGIQDKYDITLETKFETNVPMPVVTIDMPKELPQLAQGETYSFNITLTNHGLIDAKEVTLNLPNSDPEYEFLTNYKAVDIGARQSIQIGVIMQRRTMALSVNRNRASEISRFLRISDVAGQSSPCKDYVGVSYWYYCNLFTGLWQPVAFEYRIKNRDCGPKRELTDEDLALIDWWLGWLVGWGGPGNGGGGPTKPPVCPECPPPPRQEEGKVADVTQPPGYKQEKSSCVDCINDMAGAIFGPGAKLLLGAFESGVCGGYNIIGAIGGAPVISCMPDLTGMAKDRLKDDLSPGPKNKLGKAADKLEELKDAVERCKNTESAPLPPSQTGRSVRLHNNSTSGLYEELYRSLQATYDVHSAKGHWALEYFGEMLNADSWPDVKGMLEPYITQLKEIPQEQGQLIWNNIKGGDLESLPFNKFLARWNTSIEALSKNIYEPNTVYPGIINWNLVKRYSDSVKTGIDDAKSRGYGSVNDMYISAISSLEKIIDEQQNHVCASVTVQFNQQLAMAREAFEGTLEIANGHPTEAMKQLKVDIQLTDEKGIPANGLFEIQTKDLTGLTDVTGTGQIDAQAKGSVKFLFIPETGAAPQTPKKYNFGGTVTYWDPYAQAIVTLPLAPVTLTVNPSPNLTLHYFMQRNILGDDALTTDLVEPSVPAELAVMVQNDGYGDAINMSISSAQPKVVDNEKGLAIKFELIGSNFQGQPKKLGQTDITFGNVPALQSRIGQWYFTSSLLGKFVSYDAKVVHANSFGNPELSLVKDIKLHELTKSIRAYGSADDGINDFLVNDVFDVNDQPDMIYFSQGRRTAKVNQAAGTFSEAVKAPSFTNKLTLNPVDTGYNYIRIDDPGNNQYEIVSVTRKDGQSIPPDNAWLGFVTLPVSRSPVYENKFHFVDRLTSKQATEYTVVWKPKNADVLVIDSIYTVPTQTLSAQLGKLKVRFNKPVNTGTFTTDDITLLLQGKSTATSDIVIKSIDPHTFELDLSKVTSGNGLYVLTVQAAEISDIYGQKGKEGKAVSWSQFISVPAVISFEGLPESRLAASFNNLQLRFNLPIDAATIVPGIFTIKKGNTTLGGKPMIDSVSSDRKSVYLSGLKTLLTQTGNYTISIDMIKVRSAGQVSGIAQQSVELTIDNTGPGITTIEKLTDGAIDPQHIPSLRFSFNEQVEGFNISAVKLTRNGDVVPLTIGQLVSTDQLNWKAENFGMATYPEGQYTFRIDLTKVTDKAGNTGTDHKELRWTVKRISTLKITQTALSPDLGNSGSDGITSGNRFNVKFKLSEPAKQLLVQHADKSGEESLANVTNQASGEISLPVSISTGGQSDIRIIATDKNDLITQTSIPVFIDRVPLTAAWKQIPAAGSTRQPDTVQLIFSDRIQSVTAFATAVKLSRNDQALPSGKLQFTHVNDTTYMVKGLRSISVRPGAYQFSLDLQLFNKYSSGITGTNIIRADWSLQSANLAPVANAGNDQLIKKTGTVTLNGSPSADPDKDPLTYIWTAPEGITLTGKTSAKPTFQVTKALDGKALVFLLMVSDGQMFSTDAVEVQVDLTPPTRLTGLLNAYCGNSAPVTLTGTPAGGILSGPGVSSNIFNPTVAGPGTHTISYTVNGQTASQTTTITAVPQANIQPAVKQQYLKGKTVVLSATTGTGLTYRWFRDGQVISGVTTSTYSATQPGAYTVEITSNGCAGTSAATTLEEVYTLPADNFRLSVSSATCQNTNNGEVRIEAAAELPYTAAVTHNGTTSNHSFSKNLTLNNLSAGKYSVCISVAGQADFSQCFETEITEPKALAVYAAVNRPMHQVSLSLAGADQYIINLNDRQIITDQANIDLELSEGNNIISVTTDKSCQGIFRQIIQIANDVYPNPFTKTLHVKLVKKTARKVIATLRNTDGKLLYTQTFHHTEGVITLDLPVLVTGTYLLQIDADGTGSVYKVIRK